MSELTTLDSVWDPVRAKQGVEGRVYEEESILIASDFEGGNGCDIHRIGQDFYGLRLESEPGEHRFKGIGYYVCIGIRNRLPRRRAVTIRLETTVHAAERWHDHRHMITRRAGLWAHLDPAAIRPVSGSPSLLDVDLLLEPAAGEKDSTLFVSNFHWWPYSERVRYMRSLKDVRLREIGRSFQNRPIYAVELGSEDPQAPCILQSQTSQPSEMMGSHAIRAMIDYLLSDDPQARSIRESFRLCFVPVTNPDGAVLGYGVSDAQGRFPHFEVNLAADGDPHATPENLARWRYLNSLRPWLFWDWHSNNWYRRPGHVLIRFRPELAADERIVPLWQEIENRLLALPETHHETWISRRQGNRNTASYEAVTRLGLISCIIKQHERFSLAESREHAVACLKAATSAYREWNMAGE